MNGMADATSPVATAKSLDGNQSTGAWVSPMACSAALNAAVFAASSGLNSAGLAFAYAHHRR